MLTNAEVEVVAARLDKLGLNTASLKLKEMAERKRKLALAYEHYRFVRKEKIDAFNEKLKKETKQGQEPFSATWKTLEFCGLRGYESIPPDHVLASLETAIGHKCFDSFEIAYIKNVKDPLLFGRIHGCSDRFHIDQWDDDVKIEDILLPNEG